VKKSSARTAAKRDSGAAKSTGSKGRRSAKKASERKNQPFQMPITITHRGLLDEGGKTDYRFRQLLYDFSALGSYLESAREYLASQLGISAPQYNCAMIIAQYQSAAGVPVGEVARYLHVSTAFVTTEVKRLEQKGLVRKDRNPKDGRGVLLRLTPSGEAKICALKPQLQLVNDHLFRSMSERTFRDLATTVATLIEDFAVTSSILGKMREEQKRSADHQ